MSSTNASTASARLTTEQLLLINILNTMYTDNIRQLNGLTNSINRIHERNDSIRTAIVQLLNPSSSRARNEYRLDNIVEYIVPVNLSNDVANLENYVNTLFQPIDMYPTQAQIENATRRVRYSDITRPVNTTCPITMEDFHENDNVMVIRQCGHTFHPDSLLNWFRTNCRCPVCRFDIRDYNQGHGNSAYQAVDASFNLLSGESNALWSGLRQRIDLATARAQTRRRD